MKITERQKKIVVMFLVFVLSMSSMQITTYAHRAYFLQVLIDEGQMAYLGNLVFDNTQKESKKTEPKLWNYEGEIITNVESYDNLDKDNNGKSSMYFTFPPKPYKEKNILWSNNHATSRDSTRAYEIIDTLIPNLNEILFIMNGGERFETIDELIEASHRLSSSYNSRNSITVDSLGATISFSSDGHYATIKTKDGKETKLLVKMKKGYKEPTYEDGRKSPLFNSEFTFDEGYYSDEISIAHIITQGNYAYYIKGYSAADSLEASNPGTLEIKAAEFLSSMINSFRAFLGLRSTNELVYNQGISGSSMYYYGIMPQVWMENAMKFHMLFQALVWIALAIAMIKLLLEKNLSTINPSMRVSLMEGIKDLILTGFLLVSIFLIINLALTVNKNIVNIFWTTVSDSSNFEGRTDFSSFAGLLMQLYYLIISVYLNVVYIVRAISTSILIASSPLFIASIAFEGKNKKLFGTWLREFLANVFLQSFHAFVLSFLLQIQMLAVRGIELAVISFSLIPMTVFFRTLVTGNSSGIADSLGATGITMGASAVGGAFGFAKGASMKGSKREGSRNTRDGEYSAEGGLSIKTSESIPGKKDNPERMSHSRTVPNRGTSKDTIKNHEVDFNTLNSEKNIENNYDKLSKQPFKNAGRFDTDKLPKSPKEAVKATGKATGNALKTGASVTARTAGNIAKVGTGAAVTMALGGIGGGKVGVDMMSSGGANIVDDVKEGAKTAKEHVTDFGAKTANEIEYIVSKGKGNSGNILGAETLDNGNVVIHRDKHILKEEGLNDIVKTEDDDIKITYNREKLNDENRGYLEKIEKAYEDKKFDYLEERGISKVTKTVNGNTVVHFNEHGQKQLGYKDAYMNKNRVVETKSPGQPLESKIIYDIGSVNPSFKGGGSSVWKNDDSNSNKEENNSKSDNKIDLDSRM